jgi:hypothetical protein
MCVIHPMQAWTPGAIAPGEGNFTVEHNTMRPGAGHTPAS